MARFGGRGGGFGGGRGGGGLRLPPMHGGGVRSFGGGGFRPGFGGGYRRGYPRRRFGGGGWGGAIFPWVLPVATTLIRDNTDFDLDGLFPDDIDDAETEALLAEADYTEGFSVDQFGQERVLRALRRKGYDQTPLGFMRVQGFDDSPDLQGAADAFLADVKSGACPRGFVTWDPDAFIATVDTTLVPGAALVFMAQGVSPGFHGAYAAQTAARAWVGRYKAALAPDVRVEAESKDGDVVVGFFLPQPGTPTMLTTPAQRLAISEYMRALSSAARRA